LSKPEEHGRRTEKRDQRRSEQGNRKLLVFVQSRATTSPHLICDAGAKKASLTRLTGERARQQSPSPRTADEGGQQIPKRPPGHRPESRQRVQHLPGHVYKIAP
ncbi:unnamed protein product, partial [Ixodes hexagonus]